MQLATLALLVVVIALTVYVAFIGSSRSPSVNEDRIISGLRDEVRSTLAEIRLVIQEGQKSATDQLERMQKTMSDSFRDERKELNERLDRFSLTLQESNLEARKEANEFRASLEQSINTSLTKITDGLKELRESNEERLDRFLKSLQETSSESRKEASDARDALERSLAESLTKMTESLKEFRESNEKQLGAIAEKVDSELSKVRESNEKKLDEMRETVDEKLHGTLEKRLGESFAQVSERLEAVHKGLGEMQQLASGVGDLKRVLTNVKSRGGWGEVQLGRQLEDILTTDQYQENVAVNPNSQERVDYAIKMPGRGDGDLVYLPIDAKFPQEDYDRLVIAQDAGDVERVQEAAIQLERAIKIQAKVISEKYVRPPYTTDFAIMYLPTEGLFAEVIRRPGLCADLQRDSRVLVTGPTTLMAILNSLQMGFRTVAIEKRVSEVWHVLAAARTEFGKYANAWEKVDKQLGTVQTSVSELGRRSRAIERSLRGVESGDPLTSANVLGIRGGSLDSDPEDELSLGDVESDEN
jgi:DNA recombination protein RmuC